MPLRLANYGSCPPPPLFHHRWHSPAISHRFPFPIPAQHSGKTTPPSPAGSTRASYKGRAILTAVLFASRCPVLFLAAAQRWLGREGEGQRAHLPTSLCYAAYCGAQYKPSGNQRRDSYHIGSVLMLPQLNGFWSRRV